MLQLSYQVAVGVASPLDADAPWSIGLVTLRPMALSNGYSALAAALDALPVTAAGIRRFHGHIAGRVIRDYDAIKPQPWQLEPDIMAWHAAARAASRGNSCPDRGPPLARERRRVEGTPAVLSRFESPRREAGAGLARHAIGCGTITAAEYDRLEDIVTSVRAEEPRVTFDLRRIIEHRDGAPREILTSQNAICVRIDTARGAETREIALGRGMTPAGRGGY